MEKINKFRFHFSLYLKLRSHFFHVFSLSTLHPKYPHVPCVYVAHCTPYWIHLSTGSKMFLDINNDIYSSTPQRRDDRAIVFYIEPRFYPLLRCPIISMLSFYFISLSLSFSPCVWLVWYFSFSLSELVPGVQRESVSGVCVSLLTADESKNTQIKTSVNCVKERQTMVFIRGSSR